MQLNSLVCNNVHKCFITTGSQTHNTWLADSQLQVSACPQLIPDHFHLGNYGKGLSPQPEVASPHHLSACGLRPPGCLPLPPHPHLLKAAPLPPSPRHSSSLPDHSKSPKKHRDVCFHNCGRQPPPHQSNCLTDLSLTCRPSSCQQLLLCSGVSQHPDELVHALAPLKVTSSGELPHWAQLS